MIDYTHEAACTTTNCINNGITFDVASISGVVQNIVCGGCGTDFTANATPKE